MSMASRSKNKKNDSPKEHIKSPRTMGANDSARMGAPADNATLLEAASLAEVSSVERYHLIAKAAYYRAEQRNFNPGHELEDWLYAEAEVEQMLTRIGLENRMKHI